MSSKFLDWIKEDKHWGFLSDELLQNVCKELQNRSQNVPTHFPGWDIPGRWNSLIFRGYISNSSFWRIQEHKHFDCCRILDRTDKQCAIGPVKSFKEAFSLCFAEVEKISASENKKYGIVFSGGGAKGAFQIGVWKYLHENGYDHLFTGISGASVGALNSLLFASGSYENAEQTWLKVRQQDMTPSDINLFDFDVDTSDSYPYFTINVNINKSNLFPHPLLKKLIRLSVYTQDGLKRIIDNCDIDWLNVCSQSKIIYSVLSQKASPHISGNQSHKLFSRLTQPEYRCWAGLGSQEIIDTILASAALPIAYPSKRLHRKKYIDGGVQDNIPIIPLVQARFENILVIHLMRQENLKWEWDDSTAGLNDDPTTPIPHIDHVFPPNDFDDSFSATITVDPRLSQQRIDQGYQAACKCLFSTFPPRICL